MSIITMLIFIILIIFVLFNLLLAAVIVGSYITKKDYIFKDPSTKNLFFGHTIAKFLVEKFIRKVE